MAQLDHIEAAITDVVVQSPEDEVTGGVLNDGVHVVSLGVVDHLAEHVLNLPLEEAQGSQRGRPWFPRQSAQTCLLPGQSRWPSSWLAPLPLPVDLPDVRRFPGAETNLPLEQSSKYIAEVIRR